MKSVRKIKSRSEANEVVKQYQKGMLLKFSPPKTSLQIDAWEELGPDGVPRRASCSPGDVFLLISAEPELIPTFENLFDEKRTKYTDWTGRFVFEVLNQNKVIYFYFSENPELFFEKILG